MASQTETPDAPINNNIDQSNAPKVAYLKRLFEQGLNNTPLGTSEIKDAAGSATSVQAKIAEYEKLARDNTANSTDDSSSIKTSKVNLFPLNQEADTAKSQPAPSSTTSSSSTSSPTPPPPTPTPTPPPTPTRTRTRTEFKSSLLPTDEKRESPQQRTSTRQRDELPPLRKPQPTQMPNLRILSIEEKNGELSFENSNKHKPDFYAVSLSNRARYGLLKAWNTFRCNNLANEFKDELKTEALVKEFNYIAMGKNEDSNIVKSFISEISKINPGYNNWKKYDTDGNNDKKAKFLEKMKKIEPAFQYNGDFKETVISALKMGLYLRENHSDLGKTHNEDEDFNKNLNTLFDALHKDALHKDASIIISAHEISPRKQIKKYKSQIGQIAKLASTMIAKLGPHRALGGSESSVGVSDLSESVSSNIKKTILVYANTILTMFSNNFNSSFSFGTDASEKGGDSSLPPKAPYHPKALQMQHDDVVINKS